ncbi:MAG: sugar phosphate nucleotidyltransferase, partial [Candidatus Omnitrophica bacterium]|nr:sugar phosphate nucleotidyltransferase [Candidatus Omnitrophota bacterium]
MRALILCAGFGTRLYPLTKNLPKPLLKLNDNKTVLDCIIDKLINRKNIKEIIVISNRKFITLFR